MSDPDPNKVTADEVAGLTTPSPSAPSSVVLFTLTRRMRMYNVTKLELLNIAEANSASATYLAISTALGGVGVGILCSFANVAGKDMTILGEGLFYFGGPVSIGLSLVYAGLSWKNYKKKTTILGTIEEEESPASKPQ